MIRDLIKLNFRRDEYDKINLFRKLKSLTGLTYVSFIRNIRMKAACHIMEEKNMCVFRNWRMQ